MLVFITKTFYLLLILNVQYLQESISFKLKIGHATYNFLSFCRSPSQNQNDFVTFFKTIDLNLLQRNTFLVVETLMLNQAHGFVKTKQVLKVMQSDG